MDFKDVVDLERLQRLGSMKASAHIILVDGWNSGPAETLRSRVFKDLQRAKANEDISRVLGNHNRAYLTVLYHEEKHAQLLDLKGRQPSGLRKLEEIPNGLEEKEKIEDLVRLGLSCYEATRSCFSAPKLYKEAARPADCSDFDLRKSFPATIAARYQDLTVVQQWCQDPNSCLVDCGMAVTPSNLKVLKEFCNSAAGSGEPVLQKFLADAALQAAPRWAVQYRDALRLAATRDEAAHPAWCLALRQAGVPADKIRNKVHYLVNCVAERQRCEAGRARVGEDLAMFIGLESDGVVAIPLGQQTPDGLLNLMGPDFAIKPYRSWDGIISGFKAKYPMVAPHLFDEVDVDWEVSEGSKLESIMRIRRGEKPSRVLATCVPDFILDAMTAVKDVYRSCQYIPQPLKTFEKTAPNKNSLDATGQCRAVRTA